MVQSIGVFAKIFANEGRKFFDKRIHSSVSTLQLGSYHQNSYKYNENPTGGGDPTNLLTPFCCSFDNTHKSVVKIIANP